MAKLVSRRNPYIIGRPIDDSKLLFGRQDLFYFVEDNLSKRIKVTVLHGQRRIGKSSIIRNIPKSVKLEDFVFIPFNLEDYTRENLSRILADLAQAIIEYLEIDTEEIKLPNIQDLDKEPYIFYTKFLKKVLDKLDGKKIVFLLDEFEALSDKYSASLLKNFFNYLHYLIKEENRLFLIVFAGRQSKNVPNLVKYFQNASTREIGFLNKDSATQLITQPAWGILEYEPEAIQAIIKLSAGHPYFIQVICFAIFVRARELDESRITLEDVNNIVDKAIENAEAGLAWFWDGLTIPEKIVFSAVAESQKIAIEKSQTVLQNPLELIKQYGIFKIEVLEQAVKELVAANFLDEKGEKIKIELVRQWLLQRHSLRQEIKELEKLNEKNSYSYEEKKYLAVPEKKQNNFDNDNPSLVPNAKSKSAVAERFLPLDPEHPITIFRSLEPRRIKETEIPQQQENQSTSKLKVYPLAKSRLSKGIHFLAFAGVMTICATFVGISASYFSTRCFASENKVLGIFCTENPRMNLSSGDRTFFPIINNTYRNQAIESFKTADYSTATKLFAQATKSDRKDPEVLIYYNNARAQEKGNPFTLAVVVPANDTEFAQDILRGVAQAQKEFNDKDGLNGRLLSVIIANDGDGKEPKRAKQVAAELVKTKSLLGVIGHNYSEATEAALTEYQKQGIPIISPASTITSLHESKVFFRTVPSNAAMGEKLAKYAIGNLNITRVAIFKTSSLFSQSMTEEFQNKFEELGGKIVHEVDLTTSTLNAQKEINLSLDNQAQAAVLLTDKQYIDVALDIAKANNNLINSSKNQVKRKLKLLGTNPLYSDETLSKGGKAVEGLITVVPWFRDTAEARKYAQTAKKLWTVDVGWRTASSYDAAQAFIQYLSADSNYETTLASLESANFLVKKTSGYPIKFSPQRERETEPILLQIKDGKYVAIP